MASHRTSKEAGLKYASLELLSGGTWKWSVSGLGFSGLESGLTLDVSRTGGQQLLEPHLAGGPCEMSLRVNFDCG